MTRAGQLNEFTDYDVKFQIQKEVDFFDINVVTYLVSVCKIHNTANHFSFRDNLITVSEDLISFYIVPYVIGFFTR